MTKQTKNKTNKMAQMFAATGEMSVDVCGITINCTVYLNSFSYKESLEEKKRILRQQGAETLRDITALKPKLQESPAEQIKESIKLAESFIESIDEQIDEVAQRDFDFVKRTLNRGT